MTLSNDSRDRVKHAFEPIALAMGRAGLSPDALTLIGFAITVIGAVVVSQQLWLVGGFVVLIGGVFDMFDGTLARATGQVSKLGAFMDSVFDRWGEALVYVGLIAGLGASGWVDAPLFAAAAMASAFMVSYTRAKSEGLGFTAGRGMAAVGIMPREVRLVILSAGLVLGGLFGTTITVPERGFQGAGGAGVPFGIVTIEIALGIIAVGATITTIQRILHVRSQARQQASSQATETNT
jgi:CDP-diacylglycerol--glycerol-3-phosphate 3-phosphatidyltransferase